MWTFLTQPLWPGECEALTGKASFTCSSPNVNPVVSDPYLEPFVVQLFMWVPRLCVSWHCQPFQALFITLFPSHCEFLSLWLSLAPGKHCALSSARKPFPPMLTLLILTHSSQGKYSKEALNVYLINIKLPVSSHYRHQSPPPPPLEKRREKDRIVTI